MDHGLELLLPILEILDIGVSIIHRILEMLETYMFSVFHYPGIMEICFSFFLYSHCGNDNLQDLKVCPILVENLIRISIF